MSDLRPAIRNDQAQAKRLEISGGASAVLLSVLRCLYLNISQYRIAYFLADARAVFLVAA